MGIFTKRARAVQHAQALRSRQPTAQQGIAQSSRATSALLVDREDTCMDDVWTTSSWLRSLGLHMIIAKALEPDRGAVDDFVYMSKQLSDDNLRERLTAAGLAGLVLPISDALGRLREQKAPTGAALASKFKADGDAYKGEMGFASLDVFFSGLEGLVGPPRMVEGSLLKQMECEHTCELDSARPFSTSNGINGATSREEWGFVVHFNPDHRYVERTDGFDAEHPEWRRAASARTIEQYVAEMDSHNARLKSKGHSELVIEEVVGGRLYTGPMYAKYNGVLRCFSSPLERAEDHPEPHLQQVARNLGLGKWWHDEESSGRVAWQWINKYATTLHAINSCVLKLSKLTKLSTVYRGFTDSVLPRSFFTPNEDGVCGGVEYGFTSTSTSKAQAVHYAAGKASTLFMNRMGMVDRGADLSWLSQYPHEQEILFPPLVGLEVLATTVHGSMLVVEARFSLNMSAQTLEQVVSKRRKMILDMAAGLHVEVRNALVSGAVEKAWNEEQAGLRGQLASAVVRDGLAMARSVDWLNEDVNFSQAVKWTLETKKKLSRGAVDHLDLNHFGWLRHLPEQALNLDETRHLNLRYCSELLELPEQVGMLTHLVRLSLYGCKCLTALPESIAQCSQLEEIDCQACVALAALPDGIGTLRKLAQLNLYGCRLVARIPTVLDWPELVTLNLSGCNRLTVLPPSLGACSKLKDLNLANCNALYELPDLSNQSELQVLGKPGSQRRSSPKPLTSERPHGNVLVSTFANLFSFSSGGSKYSGEEANVSDMQELMAMRIQHAARTKMRYKLFCELQRITANERAAIHAASRNPTVRQRSKRAPTDAEERSIQRNGGMRDEAKASAIKARLAEQRAARAVKELLPSASSPPSEEALAQQKLVAQAMLQAGDRVERAGV